MRNYLFAFCIVAILATDCGKSNEPLPIQAPVVSDVTVTDIKYHKATLTAEISGSLDSVCCGFVISKKGSSYKQEIICTPKDGRMSYNVGDLEADTQFCVWAMADNGKGVRIYSPEKVFRTEALPSPEFIVPFEDLNFKKWVVVRYDIDGDGEISYEEAQKVDNIETKTDEILSVKGIEYFTNLRNLSLVGSLDGDLIRKGKLTELDISNNTHLQSLSIDGNQIKKIDLSGLTELTYMGVGRNLIDEIDFSSQKDAYLISCSYANIKTCDLRGLDKLDELHLDGNIYLESVQLDNKKLKYIDFSGSNLKSLDVSKCPVLNVFSTMGNKELEAIYISRKQAIGTIVKEDHTEIRYVD